MTLADRIVLLHAGADAERYGSIAQSGAPLELYHRPASRFVAGFIGSPRMNFLPGSVAGIGPQGVTVALAQTGERVSVAVEGSGLQPGQPVTFGVRPEHLELALGESAAGNEAGHDAQGVTLTRGVALVERLGEHSYVHLDQPGGDVLIAKVPGGAQIDRGHRVTFRASAAACHLFTEDGRAVPLLQTAEHVA
jgi:multiple sugar transport system ATP-binding protein